MRSSPIKFGLGILMIFLILTVAVMVGARAMFRRTAKYQMPDGGYTVYLAFWVDVDGEIRKGTDTKVRIEGQGGRCRFRIDDRVDDIVYSGISQCFFFYTSNGAVYSLRVSDCSLVKIFTAIAGERSGFIRESVNGNTLLLGNSCGMQIWSIDNGFCLADIPCDCSTGAVEGSEFIVDGLQVTDVETGKVYLFR